MPRPRLVLAACAAWAVLAGLSVPCLTAQDASLALRGAVVAELGERVPYALVALAPGATQFTTDDGRFAFEGLRPGRYRLVVRQVGYRPFDSTITLGTVAVSIRVVLARIAVRLPAIAVAAEAACVAPGPPDSTREPELFALFQQLRENARRARVLESLYPYRLYATRLVTLELDDGRSATRRQDTLEYRSSDRWQYRPGRVVAWGRGRLSRAKVVHIPELPDLADSVFHRYHCFRLGGLDTLDGRAFVRLDFRAAASLRETDTDGSAWLDPETYMLRRLRIELTRPERELRGVATLSATAVMREELPFILLTESILGITTYREVQNGIVAQTEEQRFVRVEFERRPGAAPR